MGLSQLAYPDRTLLATLSGGSWNAGLPLANIQNPLISKVARTTDALAASSTIIVDLGAQYPVQMCAILGHNLTIAATIRFRGYTDVGMTVLAQDSGGSAWPASYTATDAAAAPTNTIRPLGTATARYWKVEIVDTANPAGYIQLGRVWIGPSWIPAVGVAYGADIMYDPRSISEESLGGVLWFDLRAPRRKGTISFPALTPIERRTAILLQRNLSNSGELIYVEDSTAAPEDMLLFSFPATMEMINPIKAAYFQGHELPIGLLENI